MGTVRDHRRSLAVARARALGRDDTDAEAHLWNALRARRLGGWRWRRQATFGPYILDLLCREAALAVELDGAQHAAQRAYDARRTAWLERHGLRVIRFWNSQVLENLDGVCLEILEHCGGDHPNFEPYPPLPPLPPRSGEGED